MEPVSKKVLFVIPAIERGGGAERVCVLLANALRKKGYRISIQLLNAKNTPCYPVSDGIEILPPLNYCMGLYGAVLHFLFRCFKKNDFPECVISFLEPANVFSAVLAKFTRTKVILTERSNPLKKVRDEKNVARIRKNLPYIFKYVMQTLRCAEKFPDYLPVKKEQLAVIYNPVINNFADNVQVNKSDILLAVGRLIACKGYERLIRIFSVVHGVFPEKKLYICGSGPEEKNLRKMVQEYNIEDSVCFCGNVENIEEYYKKADVFLMTSYYEGMPNAMLEAYAAGCPAIAFDFDFGASDIIVDGVNGFIIPQDDEEAFAEAVIKYLKEPEIRERFVKNIPETMKKFSSEVIVAQWEELINE